MSSKRKKTWIQDACPSSLISYTADRVQETANFAKTKEGVIMKRAKFGWLQQYNESGSTTKNSNMQHEGYVPNLQQKISIAPCVVAGHAWICDYKLFIHTSYHSTICTVTEKMICNCLISVTRLPQRSSGAICCVVYHIYNKVPNHLSEQSN